MQGPDLGPFWRELYHRGDWHDVVALGAKWPSEALHILVTTNSGHYQHFTIFSELLKVPGADPNWVDEKGSSLLHLVIHHTAALNSVMVARALLDAHAQVDVLDERGMRPLYWCCLSFYADAGDLGLLMLEYGAAPLSREEKARLAMEAAEKRYEWYGVRARAMGTCLMAAKAAHRALSKSGLIHKDVIPLVCRYVWATRHDEEIWIK